MEIERDGQVIISLSINKEIALEKGAKYYENPDEDYISIITENKDIMIFKYHIVSITETK